jgi:hypothetical protein
MGLSPNLQGASLAPPSVSRKRAELSATKVGKEVLLRRRNSYSCTLPSAMPSLNALLIAAL